MDLNKGGDKAPHDDNNKHSHDDRHPKIVEVELNDSPKRIAAGEYTGKKLKEALGAPVDHQLDLVTKGKFDEVKNEEKIRINGGEKFVSYCGQGQSS